MAFIKRALRNWYVVTIAAAVLVALVLCFGLPLFILVLRPWWVRLLLAVLVAASWGVAAWLRMRRAARAAAKLEAAVATENEGDVAAGRLRGALAQLRGAAGGRRDYLYARPWYVLIGPPGAGKTTALRASGLRFPVVDQAMKGAGGTRNLDFWFADEAVLVDTAGRYTTQDSDAAEDAAGWKGFLQALRRHRPARPINGVLVAIGVDDIATGDVRAIDDHAAAVRRRLAELSDTLGVDLPVYCLFTKADLLAGFAEYFADLDVEGRRAVLGHSFAVKETVDAVALAGGFDTIVQAVADRQPARLAAEPDVQRRGLILGFPTQLGALRAGMVRFLEGAFPPNPAGGSAAMLRGFYLTSGTQEGTPLDRLLAGVAEVFDRHQAATGSGGGRAYFLNRLLTEVVFPEAGLARLRTAARRSRAARAGGAVAAVVAVALLIAVLWTVSFLRNRHEQDALAVAARTAEESVRQRGIDMVQVSANDAGLEEAAAALDQLRALPGGYADRAAGYPPMTMRFGLWQRGLSDEAVQAYEQALRRILLPRVMLRMEAVLAGVQGDPLAVYEPLKAYLMIGGQRPGGVDARSLRAFVTADWERGALAGADRANLRRRLAAHLDALIAAGELERVWANRQVPLDTGIVTAARATVQSMPPADRAYAMLRYGTGASAGRDWQAGRVISPAEAAAFADPAAVAGLSVPYFLTRDGYAKAYRSGLLTIADQLRRDAWVLGSEGGSGIGELASLRPQIAERYAADYAAAWDGVVGALKPGALFTDPAALGAFTRLPSPFAKLLREVRANTQLGNPDAVDMAAAGLMNRATARLGAAAPAASAALAPAGGNGADAGAMIAAHFAELNSYVGDGRQPSPLDQFVDAVKTGGQAVLAARAGGAAGGPALQVAVDQANATIALQAQQAPGALKSFAAGLAEGGAIAKSAVAQGNLQQAWAQTMLPTCRAATQDRYPFFVASTADASVSETLQLFGAGGLPGFVEANLKPVLDTSGPVWRWRSDDPAAAAFDPGSADALAKTIQIRDLLIAGQPFKAQLATTGPGVDAVELSAGTTYRLDATTREARQYQWSLQGGLPEAHVTLFKGGQKVDEIATAGPWAIFRLFDKARRRNDGQTAFLATFGSGDATATLRIILPDDRNPFGHGGLWTFRCPSTL